MIKPDRHTNLNISVISVSAFILVQINAFYDISYDELCDKIISHMGIDAKENLPYALNLLFLLGKIEYLETKDSFKYYEAQ